MIGVCRLKKLSVSGPTSCFPKKRHAGGAPCTPNSPKHQITERQHPVRRARTKRSRRRRRLSVVADVAIVEVHVPRAVRYVGAGSRRPIVGRLHIAKGMALGKGRVCLCRIHQARQLLDRREAPAFTTSGVQIVAIRLSGIPIVCACTRRLLPDGNFKN